MTRRTAITTLAALGIIALIVLILALAAANHSSNTRACHAQGGTVHVDHDTKRVYDKKTGKWKTKTTTEHECIVNGQEVNEW